MVVREKERLQKEKVRTFCCGVCVLMMCHCGVKVSFRVEREGAIGSCRMTLLQSRAGVDVNVGVEVMSVVMSLLCVRACAAALSVSGFCLVVGEVMLSAEYVSTLELYQVQTRSSEGDGGGGAVR